MEKVKNQESTIQTCLTNQQKNTLKIIITLFIFNMIIE